jgi:hypothetical protein
VAPLLVIFCWWLVKSDMELGVVEIGLDYGLSWNGLTDMNKYM